MSLKIQGMGSDVDFCLGELYEHGLGVTEDHKVALHYFLLASEE